MTVLIAALLFYFPDVAGAEELFQVAWAFFGGDFVKLVVDDVLEAGQIIPGAQYAYRCRKSGTIFHMRKQERVGGPRVMRVMDHQIGFADAIAECDDFDVAITLATNALIAIFAEDQRLAVFQLNHVFAAGLLFGDAGPRAVVEDVAVLQNFDERAAFVGGRCAQGIFQVGLKNVHGAGHKGSFRANRERNGIEWAIGRAVRSGLGYFVKFGRGGILALGQSINTVVEKQNFDADVAAQHVDGVITADGQGVAVAGDQPDFQFRAVDLDARGHGRRAAVNGVKAEGVHVIRKTAGAADAGDDDEIFATHAKLRENGLHRGENGVVAAAGTPANFLVGLKIFFGEHGQGGCGHRALLNSQHLFYFLFEFGLFEGPALNFVQAHGRHEKFCAQDPEKLAHVEFRDEDFFVALQDVTDVFRKRIQMAQVKMADLAPLFPLRLHGLGNGAGGGAPGDDEQVAFGIAGWCYVGDILGDAFDFCGADAHHVFV